MTIVRLDNISHKFAGMAVLNSLDLTLEQGEVLGLFGHNGAGKTTSMKMILGLIKPEHGQITVFGEDPSRAEFNHHRYQIGFLPENVSFYQQLTGFEVLRFYSKLKKVSKVRCLQLLEQVGLAEAASRKVKTYSKGMKQRLGLAQAILTQPSLLLLDEPTVGLDPLAIQDFYLLVDKLRSQGCSIILCSHILAGIERHIDKAAILKKGHLVAKGSIQQLREHAKLNTQIKFSGCFNIEDLSKKLAHRVNRNNDGSFSLMVEKSQKMLLINKLLAQPGLQDLDTLPPNLERLYQYYSEPTMNTEAESLTSPLDQTNQSTSDIKNCGAQS